MRLICFQSLVLFFCIFSIQIFAAELDSVVKSSQNYSFRPQLLVNYFNVGKSSQHFKHKSEQLNYRFQEFSLSGYLPIYEKKFNSRYSKSDQASLSLLFTGSLSSSRAFFQFTDTKPVLRVSAGLRAIYFTGNKGIWMMSFAPFVSAETRLLGSSIPRFFGSVLYTRMVNEYFSYRLGVSYSYLFNGGSILPVIGIRIGDYQKVFLSIQIPRDISLNWTINNHWQTGVFGRLSGGIYRFDVKDTIAKFQDVKGKAVYYRTDVLTGVMLNYSPNSQFYFSVNAGIAHGRDLNVAFSNEFIPVKAHVLDNSKVSPAPFVNISIAIYFGKPTYSGAYNYLIEQKASNNTIDVGGFNLGNNQITNDMNKVNMNSLNKKDIKKMNDRYMDVKDFLLDE